ncbi:calcium/sodium antiporter [Lentisalinibacter orientalis]|uniref:calcium/sodium antiporter n=1 Tax=Lentisalinibacter orientalis TaxID=2992241 RepID=UPI00386E7CE1
MYDSLVLLIGLVVLIKSADFLVAGASSIAARLGISSLVIGLTIVSFGTSLPEMLVTMVSGLRNNADLAIANVIGSNIANVLLVLGIAAIVRPLRVQDSTVVSEIPFSLTAALLVGFLANAALFSPIHELSISRLDGGILLFFFVLFMLYVYKMSREQAAEAVEASAVPGTTRASIYIVGGIVGLYFGGGWVVDGAVGIAQWLGVDDALIGLTVIAIGTSSPELVASAVAAYRNQSDIAVGNVVGSNIFNLLWVLGLTSSVVELPFEVISNTDLVMVIASSAMIIIALAFSRNSTILRSHGIAFVTMYVAYLVYVVGR